MNRILFLLLFLPFAAVASAQNAVPKPLTVAEIYRGDRLSGVPPSELSWSPDGKALTYISDNGELMAVDLATGKPFVMADHDKLAATLSDAGNEKDKDHRNRYKMAAYQWSPDSTHLLFDTNGQLWYYDLHNQVGVQVGVTGAGSGDDPKFSPNGTFISYLKEHNLYIKRIREDELPALQLTNTHESTTLLNGEVDWVYQEELNVRSNYFWSPDSKHIAFLQMNEDHVPQYPLTDWIPVHASVDNQRFPMPGDSNPDVRIGVVGTNAGRTVWIKLPLAAGQDYVPRFGWVNGHTVWAEVLTRDHKHKALYFADSATGVAKKVYEETAEKFFDENYDVEVLDRQLLLTSWRDGHTHIYAYNFSPDNPMLSDLTLARQLTSGAFEVSGIQAIDAQAQTVYYLSNEGDPRQQQIWSIRLDGTQKKQLSKEVGVHDPNFAPIGGSYVDTWSSTMTPHQVSVCSDAHGCRIFWNSRSLAQYALKTPLSLEIKGSEGTILYASLLLPDSTKAGSVPLIVNPYGGPHSQTVKNQWGHVSFLFDQLLAQHGFAVLHVDNRGMGGRGRDFAYAAYRNFGPVQLQDQLTAIDTVLSQYPQLDAKRLGWWGWSWGGSFTLYAMSHSDRFAAGVSVAPVTDWRNYDSVYTERFLGRPEESPVAYKDFSVVNQADKLKGHLLLVHGTGDDNVHVGNSIQYIQRLIDADIPFDLQLYPRKTHAIAGQQSRTHLFERILAHFEQYLQHPAETKAAEVTQKP